MESKNEMNGSVKFLVWDMVSNRAWDQAFAQVGKIWNHISAEIMEPVLVEIDGTIRDNIRDQLTYQAGDQKFNRMWDQASIIGSGKSRTQMGTEWELK